MKFSSQLKQILSQQSFLILDGGLATELERRGADLKDILWSGKILMESPELIQAVHQSYLEAGADILISASYQISYEGGAKKQLSEEMVTELLLRSVQIANAAKADFIKSTKRKPIPLVAASIGPYGAMLADGSEYRGDYGISQEELMHFHRKRMQVLAGSGADFFAIETIPSIVEAKAIMELLKEFPEMEAWITCSCKDEQHMSDGTPFSDLVALANDFPQIFAVGINCTSPDFILPLLESAKHISAKSFVVYPNSGEQWDAENHCWISNADNITFSKQAQKWLRAGASFIGGCCRTSPEDIQELRGELL